MNIDAQAKKAIDLLSPFLSQALKNASADNRPLILGVTGLQGSGKSTWAQSLLRILTDQHGLRAVTVSLDDFYQPHDQLVALRESDRSNGLWRRRGQPGTHDELLGQDFFARLREVKDQSEIRIPSFDKSCFDGEGDRLPVAEWPVFQGPVDVVVFEGWCVGFRPLKQHEIEQQWQEAVELQQNRPIPDPRAIAGTIAKHKIEHLLAINHCLDRYCATFMGPQHFDFLIHLDTDNMQNVFDWRLQQEAALIRMKGCGMTDEEVLAFVQGYMPAYEMYLEGLKEGFFDDADGNHDTGKRQVTVLLDSQRTVKAMHLI